MTEFMANDALKFVTVKFLESSARNRDHGVTRRQPGSEGIDRRLFVKNVHRRHWHARSDGHFFNHVEETPFIQVGRMGTDLSSSHTLGDGGAARGEFFPF